MDTEIIKTGLGDVLDDIIRFNIASIEKTDYEEGEEAGFCKTRETVKEVQNVGEKDAGIEKGLILEVIDSLYGKMDIGIIMAWVEDDN